MVTQITYKSCPNMVRMGDKALALRALGSVLYPPYVPIGHDVCNTYKLHLPVLNLTLQAMHTVHVVWQYPQ